MVLTEKFLLAMVLLQVDMGTPGANNYFTNTKSDKIKHSPPISFWRGMFLLIEQILDIYLEMFCE